jgi:small-conductance mechanosensitive channel
MRKVGEVSERIRGWLEHLGDRALSVRVQRIELVTPAMLKSTALIANSLAKWLGQFGIFYTWLLLVLSLFEATRGYTQRLTGFVVTPFSQFAERLAIALPLLVVATIAALAVLILVRFVGLFFAGAARQETALGWLPPDLAQPTSVLVRIAIVVGSLVFAAPVVTGDPNGSLGRAGAVALIVIGLSGTPLFATGLVGAFVVFGRRLRVGEHVEFAGALGRIASINLLELRLETAERTELRLPHLLLLKSPLRGLAACRASGSSSASALARRQAASCACSSKPPAASLATPASSSWALTPTASPIA